uniref:Transmembrane protein 70 homolog, mitochondrial n=1 Tax=Parastrongyloides trichosuri TaxID=131310 RepID=A0A0N4ZUH6_PARTI
MLFILNRGLLNCISRNSLLNVNLCLKNTSNRNFSNTNLLCNVSKCIPLSSIDKSTLGHSILHLKENGAETTPTDYVKKGIIAAKIFSLSSSSAGLIMIPYLTSYLWTAATERPGMMVFTILANTFLGILTFTPLLLHFLTKRFVSNIYYNHDTKVYTSIQYNFLLRKMALQFKASDVVDPTIAPEAKKLYIPLATAFVHGKPLMISLDRNQYRDQLAFDEMTKNIHIPIDAD